MPLPGTNRVVFLTALAWAAGLFAVAFLIRLAIFAINTATNDWIDPYMGGYIHSLFLGLSAGAGIAGYWMARMFSRFPPLRGIRPWPTAAIWAGVMLLYPFLYFSLANLFFPRPANPQPLAGGAEQASVYLPPFLALFGTAFITWAIPGTLGGLLFALHARSGGPRLGFERAAWIAAGWGFGFALGGGVNSLLSNLAGWVMFQAQIYPLWFANELMIWLGFGVVGFTAGGIGALATLAAARQVSPITPPAAASHVPRA